MNYIQTKKKKEINQRAGGKALPFSVACRACCNSLHDICVEDCAVYKDFIGFETIKEMDPIDLPRFTMKEYRELPGKIKGELLAFYIIKLMEVLYVPDR
jgi:hypothetical protein